MAGLLPESHSLSAYEKQEASKFRYALVVAQWNEVFTSKLKEASLQTLLDLNVPASQIHHLSVPGSFELPLAAKWALEELRADAVICLGCIIQGETKHDQYIAQAIANGIMNLNLSHGKPVVFGVLTVHNEEQAADRSGGVHGNKGVEATVAAVKVLTLRNAMR
ncbi:MAG TPA: 6,7-dimethyl-8-ribityllumazine synthase [Saprospiraceae bacterium]|nr:6,7-dimethyl-8-ribityllumazine synthase [Saprospiraceae bacterium]